MFLSFLKGYEILEGMTIYRKSGAPVSSQVASFLRGKIEGEGHL
jgi:hypothetical protein